MTDATVPAIGLVLDCSDPERLAEFWAPALDYVSVGTVGSYVALFPNGRAGPKLLLQKVAEPKSVKNRMHFDMEVRDIRAQADRLVGLGATKVREEPCSEHGSTWILMTDPEGNEFCVCDAGQAGEAPTEHHADLDGRD
jgi:predicted enzyme related to lactoylglutathione lyase